MPENLKIFIGENLLNNSTFFLITCFVTCLFIMFFVRNASFENGAFYCKRGIACWISLARVEQPTLMNAIR